ncbi:MAG: Protein translocase SecG subunit [Hyphomonadaceae bacterium]|nr:MAG: Protein translocase SecG subunit [Hyphomonadaceae bacterium]KAF0186385.1 MAG: Protein translocase SecG subunit [Hyphomonadaceae bacterium]
MFIIILSIHLVVCIALIGSVLMQKSEGGGALGIGGGPSGLMSGRSAANFMTRTTAILGTIFFATSIGLTILSGNTTKAPGSLMQDNSLVNGLPTKGIDLSGTASPAKATPSNSVIPESSAAPVINGLGAGLTAQVPVLKKDNTVNEKK